MEPRSSQRDKLDELIDVVLAQKKAGKGDNLDGFKEDFLSYVRASGYDVVRDKYKIIETFNKLVDGESTQEQAEIFKKNMCSFQLEQQMRALLEVDDRDNIIEKIPAIFLGMEKLEQRAAIAKIKSNLKEHGYNDGLLNQNIGYIIYKFCKGGSISQLQDEIRVAYQIPYQSMSVKLGQESSNALSKISSDKTPNEVEAAKTTRYSSDQPQDTNQVKELKDQLSQTEAAVQREKRKQQRSLESISALELEIASLQKSQQVLDNEMKEVRKKLRDVLSREEESEQLLRVAHASIVQMSDELKQTKNELIESQARIERIKEGRDQLERVIEEQARMLEMKEHITDSPSKIEVLETRRYELERKFVEQGDKIKELEDTIKKLQEENLAQHRLIAHLQQQGLEQKVTESGVVKSLHEQLSVGELQKRNKQLSESLATLQGKLSEFRGIFNLKDAVIQKQRKQIEKIRKMNRRLRDKHDQLKIENQKLVKGNQQLKEELQALKAKNHELESRLTTFGKNQTRESEHSKGEFSEIEQQRLTQIVNDVLRKYTPSITSEGSRLSSDKRKLALLVTLKKMRPGVLAIQHVDRIVVQFSKKNGEIALRHSELPPHVNKRVFDEFVAGIQYKLKSEKELRNIPVK